MPGRHKAQVTSLRPGRTLGIIQAIPPALRNYTQIMGYTRGFGNVISLKRLPDPFQEEAFKVVQTDAESENQKRGAAP